MHPVRRGFAVEEEFKTCSIQRSTADEMATTRWPLPYARPLSNHEEPTPIQIQITGHNPRIAWYRIQVHKNPTYISQSRSGRSRRTKRASSTRVSSTDNFSIFSSHICITCLSATVSKLSSSATSLRSLVASKPLIFVRSDSALIRSKIFAIVLTRVDRITALAFARSTCLIHEGQRIGSPSEMESNEPEVECSSGHEVFSFRDFMQGNDGRSRQYRDQRSDIVWRDHCDF
jgi:hypothetical protein